MEGNLFKLVYCSRNRLQGTKEEIASELHNILASARKNNPPLGITGALLYNAGNFAQILEGPLPSIERIFEVIQCDPRHSEVTVIHTGPSSKRDFPDWSMAFAGANDPGKFPEATAAFESVYAHAADAGEHMLEALKNLIISEDDWILIEAA